MGRIMSDDVVKAFRTTEINPIADEWAFEAKNERYGCAITAIAVERGVEFKSIIGLLEYESDVIVVDFLANALGLELDYTVGFFTGFDETPVFDLEEENDSFKLGYFDGLGARKAVNSEFYVLSFAV